MTMRWIVEGEVVERAVVRWEIMGLRLGASEVEERMEGMVWYVIGRLLAGGVRRLVRSNAWGKGGGAVGCKGVEDGVDGIRIGRFAIQTDRYQSP